MTPPYSVHTAPADTTHAKASAAKRLRSSGVVGSCTNGAVRLNRRAEGLIVVVYQVSDLGQVRNTNTNNILHPIKLKNGRIYVTLSCDGFQEKCTVHSLVADAFFGKCHCGHRSGSRTATTATMNSRPWSTSATRTLR
jgi:hypothetical protein